MVIWGIRGLEWDVEQGSTVMLRLSADPAVWGRLVPYQLRMMQEQAMDRLLPLAAGEENGRFVLHYELGGTRRLVQRLYAEPPDCRLAVELAHRIVRTVADSKAYMLQESGFLLHEDFVYAGCRPTDFKLCYLPLEGAVEGRVMPPATEQLRLLLLRLLSAVKDPLPSGMARVFGLLSQQPYSIAQLEQVLRKLRYGGIREGGSAESGGEQPRKAGGLRRVAGWLRKERAGWPWREQAKERRNRTEGRPMARFTAADDKTGFAADGKTGLLVRPAGTDAAAGTERTLLVFAGGGQEDTVAMETDRFLIGRNRDSVHYAIEREDVSRIHCEIVRSEDGLTVTDLGSLNGTLLNGQPMLPYKPYPFRPGDSLQVTGTTIRLAEAAETAVGETVRAADRPARKGVWDKRFLADSRAGV